LAEARTQLDAAATVQADFEARIESLQAELAARPSQEAVEEAERAAAAARDHVRQLEEQSQHNAAHIRSLEASLQGQPSDRALAELRQAHQQAEERAAQLETQLAAANAARSDADESLCRRLEAVQAELQQRPSRTDFERLKNERDELARRAQAQPAGAAPAPDVARLQKEIAKRDLAVSTLHQKLKELQAAASLPPSAAPAAASAPADPEAAARAELRRQRLARARRLLVERRDRVRSVAGQIEDKRRQLNEYESDLTGLQRRLEAQQQRVLAASNAVEEQQQSHTRGGIAKNAMATMLALVTIIAIVGGASWAIAQRAVAPTFAVQATLGMDGREDADPDVLASWREFHEQMFSDPQFMEDAAARMKRRGFLTLANPTDLLHFLENSADITFAQEGEVSMTIRTEGLERAERLMETLTTSCVAWSNNTRDLRLDNAPLAVISQVQADAAPVEDPRTIIFGAVFGGLTAIVLFGFILMQRTLSKRMRRAEVLEQEARSTEKMWADATRDVSSRG
ncbi:MAG: hypothetical protein KDA21_12615, partial [Phycisphaerales bacterium]|nr:hypothetical protein [Phycisphaerales bacterium]